MKVNGRMINGQQRNRVLQNFVLASKSHGVAVSFSSFFLWPD